MAKQQNYSELKQELDEIITKLQADDGSDIEKTIELHKRGEQLIELLQKYLESAENSIKKIKRKQ